MRREAPEKAIYTAILSTRLSNTSIKVMMLKRDWKMFEKIEKIKKPVSIVANILLLVWSVFLILQGLTILSEFSGTVYGTNFGFLITIAREIGEIFVWLGLYAIASRVTPVPKNDFIGISDKNDKCQN